MILIFIYTLFAIANAENLGTAEIITPAESSQADSPPAQDAGLTVAAGAPAGVGPSIVQDAPPTEDAAAGSPPEVAEEVEAAPKTCQEWSDAGRTCEMPYVKLVDNPETVNCAGTDLDSCVHKNEQLCCVEDFTCPPDGNGNVVPMVTKWMLECNHCKCDGVNGYMQKMYIDQTSGISKEAKTHAQCREAASDDDLYYSWHESRILDGDKCVVGFYNAILGLKGKVTTPEGEYSTEAKCGYRGRISLPVELTSEGKKKPLNRRQWQIWKKQMMCGPGISSASNVAAKKICDNCKCAGIENIKTKYSKDELEAITKADGDTCLIAAWDARYKYVSIRANIDTDDANKVWCLYGDKVSSDTACEQERETDTKGAWTIHHPYYVD